MTSEGECAFAKALLARFCACDRARWHAVGEAERLSCADPATGERCVRFVRRLRTAALFALGRGPLAHGAQLRLQWGGLQGLVQAIGRPDHRPENVATLLAEAEARYGTIEALPWEPIVRAVAACRPRRKA